MAEEPRSEIEYGEKGEVQLQNHSPVHVTPNKSIDSSAKNSLSSGTPASVSRASPSRADCYWFAQSGDYCGNKFDVSDLSKSQAKEREEKARLLRERQSGERQRKLEELKFAAIQAQKFREIQEEERRKRIEEMRVKDSERRVQVEERKKQIVEAEMERRGNLLRRSQDREAKIEAQKNAHRSSIGFAFGSSTPRMLDAEPPYLFSSRRAASQLLLCQPMTMSQSRCTSASPNVQTNTDSNDTEHAVRRRLGTSHSIDLCTEPVNFAHRHSVHETFFYGTSEPSKVLPNSLVRQNVKSENVVDKNVHLHHSLFPWEAVDNPLNPCTPNAADFKMSGLLHGSGVLVGENIMTQSLNSLSAFNRGRRRTDLIPTIPACRDSPRTRSPGKAYSMTRLDLLSLPRGKRPLRALKEEEEKMIKTKSMGNLNSGKRVGGRSLKASCSTDPRMSKSTSHLAGTQALTLSHRQQHVSSTSPSLRSDLSSPSRSVRGSSPGSEFREVKRLSQSMWQLSPSGRPKPTRSSILRQNALAAMGPNRSMLLSKNEGSQFFGGEVGGYMSRVASSPSRPQSSMSQQSFSSHSTSSVTMRSKPSRKPRPFSVAGSTSDRSSDSTDSRQGRSIDKKAAIPPTGRPPRAKSAGADSILKEAAKGEATENTVNPPDINRHSSKTQRTGSPTQRIASPKEKPKIAHKPLSHKQTAKSSPMKSANSGETDAQSVSTNVEAAPDTTETVVVAAQPQETKLQNSVDILNNDYKTTEDEGNKDLEIKEVETTKEPIILPDVIVQPKVEEPALIQPKPKITTEEEAKAVLAEKRRKAREQAEREAELERQRLEELRRQEEERLRREEEAAREWEAEVERQRKAEEERLQKAIEEQKKREEEERLKKEEEAKLKAEREKAEQLAREEQERSRKEAEEKFNREEEERAKRRKRVEDIMSRTRARDKAKNEAPMNSTTEGDDIVNNLSDSFTLQPEIIDSSPPNGRSNGLQTETILKNAENRASNITQQLSSADDLDTVHTNGFNNHNFNNDIERSYQTNCQESIIDSQCMAIEKEVSVSTLLNNLSELDLLTPTKISSTAASNPIAFSTTKTSNMDDHIRNEDNVNFNVETNVNGNNYSGHQDSGATDLLL
ncbi:hypothetical protein CHUAL_001726 [Chamberlinius hualienensis]